MQYQLKIQQLVTYAKSRVYRNFIRALSDNENIRMNGESNLFYFMTLCSYANFRTSTFRIDAMRYTLAPGEWMLLSGMNLSYKIWSVERIADYLNKTLLQYIFLRCKMIFRKIVNMKQ